MSISSWLPSAPEIPAWMSMKSITPWVPLVSMPVFAGLYPYIKELMEKFVFAEILAKNNQTAQALSIAAVTFSSMTVNIAQLAEMSSVAPVPSESTTWKYMKLGGRITLSVTAAASTALLTRYQAEEFGFDLEPSTLAFSITLLMSVEFVTAMLGSRPKELGKLWNVITKRSTTAPINESEERDEITSLFSRLDAEDFPKWSLTTGLTAAYVPLAFYGLYTLINEFYRNIGPSSPAQYTLFITCILSSTLSTVFDLDRWSKLLQELHKFEPSTVTLLTATLTAINALSASTIDAVRGYEVHEVGEFNKVLAYLSITAVLLAKFSTNVTLTQDFGTYIKDRVQDIKAALIRPGRNGEYQTIA